MFVPSITLAWQRTIGKLALKIADHFCVNWCHTACFDLRQLHATDCRRFHTLTTRMSISERYRCAFIMSFGANYRYATYTFQWLSSAFLGIPAHHRGIFPSSRSFQSYKFWLCIQYENRQFCQPCALELWVQFRHLKCSWVRPKRSYGIEPGVEIVGTERESVRCNVAGVIIPSLSMLLLPVDLLKLSWGFALASVLTLLIESESVVHCRFGWERWDYE